MIGTTAAIHSGRKGDSVVSLRTASEPPSGLARSRGPRRAGPGALPGALGRRQRKRPLSVERRHHPPRAATQLPGQAGMSIRR